jgi:hypothetical protein
MKLENEQEECLTVLAEIGALLHKVTRIMINGKTSSAEKAELAREALVKLVPNPGFMGNNFARRIQRLIIFHNEVLQPQIDKLPKLRDMLCSQDPPGGYADLLSPDKILKDLPKYFMVRCITEEERKAQLGAILAKELKDPKSFYYQFCGIRLAATTVLKEMRDAAAIKKEQCLSNENSTLAIGLNQ